MGSGVIFTDDTTYATDVALDVEATGRKFFIYGRNADVSDVLPRFEAAGFEAIKFEKSTEPQYGSLQYDRDESDFHVLWRTYPSDIMDRNLDIHQNKTRGTKLVIEEHPFCGRGAVWNVYFPFSYFDRGLLGYPHVYAFRDATDPKAYDVRRLAGRVREHAFTTIPRVFHGDIETVEVCLTAAEHAAYSALKDALFDTETTPLSIIKKLKAFVDGTDSMRGAMGKQKALPILDLNKVWPAYKSGLRRRFVSDAKVDRYLAGEFDAYIANANGFLEELSNV